MRKIWIYLHIPKCGGSTFTDILMRNHGTGFMTTNSIINNYQYHQGQVLEILDAYPHCTCLAGHKLSLDLPYNSERYQLTVVTFVRDPVDRFLSSYFYVRSHSDWVIPQAKALNLDDYIQWALVDGNQPLYIDGQALFLSGEASAEGLQRIRQHVANGRLLLFPLAHFEAVLVLLQRHDPTAFRDIWYKKRNVSVHDQVATPEQRALIASFCHLDAQLSHLADEFFYNLKAAAFPVPADFEQAMAQFRKQLKLGELGRVRRKGVSMLRRAADLLEGR